MNLILEKSAFIDFYTDLSPIFEAVPELESFTYFLSEVDVCGPAPEIILTSIVIPGEHLKQLVCNRQIQFIWGVFSAFDHPPAISLELPYADGNPDFWRGNPRPQLPGALFEIVCWDGSATLFIGINEIMATKLARRFPDIQDLDILNQFHRR